MTKSREGILLIDKAAANSSFFVVKILRRITHIQKIGHAGTLDPFATGLLILLLGRSATRLSNTWMEQQKTYRAVLSLGSSTNTYDIEGTITATSSYVPSLEQIQETLSLFQGETLQIPPMYSAKKVEGKKLYELARAGKEIERKPVSVHMEISLLSYEYPLLSLEVTCSKGTYIRSLAHDIGEKLQCHAHLSSLRRTKIGSYCVEEAVPQTSLESPEFFWQEHLR